MPGEEYDFKQVGQLMLAGGLTTLFTATIDPLVARFPDGLLPDNEWATALGKWDSDFVTAVRDLGKNLWTLLPQAMRDEYLRLLGLATPPRTITVHSHEMLFPWEIVVPTGMVNGQFRADLPPLGTAHVMGRWVPNLGARPQPQALPVRHMVVINPQYTSDPLVWSQQERGELAAMFSTIDATAGTITRAAVDGVLGRTDIQVVHFSGHGSFGGDELADLNALKLEGGDSIPAMAFVGTPAGAVAHPILFLNACTVGRVTRVVGRPGGFAARCLENGWSGLIAPYWPVYDPKAYEFSLTFYKKLKSGRSIGEALQEIRSERPNDPTAAAYSYFGDPCARMLFP